MTCDVCGTENNPDRKFCRECGNPLAVTCPNCDAANQPGDKFCGNCGHSLTEADAPTPASDEPSGPNQPEQRFVSVLFADIVGYTTLAENRDPEDVRDMLTVYFDRSRDIIEKFGGTVDKFIGDAVMGVWGASVAREDDAQRAVRAALELVDMVEALGEEIGIEDLVLRAGVNSGTTSVGPGGNEKGLVVGDLVNTASRLQSVAEPGTVFVGPATYEVTNRSIDYQYMGSRTVKGKEDDVHVYRAIRVASLVGGRMDDEIRQPPFVGRERELRLLKDGLDAVEAENRARLISFVGEAGIGKTRLAEEFKKIIDGYSHTIYWHWGRSPSYGEGVTFWALGEIIRSRAGIAEGEDSSRSRTRLRTMLTQFIPDEFERDRIELRLAGLLGLAEMPPDSRSELFASIRTFFQSIALHGPVVIVFEDLHWADAGLLEFIGELVERSTSSPILVVTLARPDLLDRRPDWGSQLRASMGARLGPLPDDDMRQLLTEYLPGVGNDVIDQIVDRVSGFPLYAVEIVRMLTSSGELIQDEGRFEYTGAPSEMALPDTLQTVIGARLDRLKSNQRSLLQDGAVLGQTFTLAAMKALRDEDPEHLESELGSLINLELLDIEDDPRSPERGQYRFVQSLIREIAYGRLNRDERRAKHQAAAEYFESFEDPELAGIVSSHYVGAFEATPKGPEREELAERALRALIDAASRAAQLHSHLQAMDLLDQAIAFTEDEGRRADLRLKAAESANLQAEVERGLDYATEAGSYYENAGDVKGVRRAATAKGDLLNSHYRSPEALEVVEAVYNDMASIEDAIDIGLAAEAARSFSLTTRTDDAIEACNRVLDTAADFDLPKTYLDTLITKATAAAFANRRLEAYTILRGASVEAENRGFLREALRAINNLSVIMYARNPRATLELGQQSLELARRAGDYSWLVRKTFDMAYHRDLRSGTYDRGEATLAELEDGTLSDFWNDLFHSLRCRYRLRQNPTKEAFEEAWEANERFAESTDPQTQSITQLTRAALNIEMGNWDEALEAVRPLIDGPLDASAWDAPWIAVLATCWLGERSKMDELSELARRTETPYLGECVEAARLAIAGDKAGSARLFTEVLQAWSQRMHPDTMTQAKALFAKLVGTEDAAARRAAQDAYEWCMETETRAFLRAFAEVMPTNREAAAVS